MASAKAQDKPVTVNQDSIANLALPVHRDSRWSFLLQSGLAYSFTDYSGFESQMTYSETPDSEIDDYISKLKNGYHLNTSLQCQLTPSFGLGIEYNLFLSKSKGEFVAETYSDIGIPIFLVADLDERIYIHFIGFNASFQQFAGKGKRIKLSETLSQGIVAFRDETRSYEFKGYYEHANNVSKSLTLGVKGGLAIKYIITPHLSAGIAGSFTWARLKKLSVKTSSEEIDDMKLQNPLNISHVDYGVSFRYNF